MTQREGLRICCPRQTRTHPTSSVVFPKQQVFHYSGSTCMRLPPPVWSWALSTRIRSVMQTSYATCTDNILILRHIFVHRMSFVNVSCSSENSCPRRAYTKNTSNIGALTGQRSCVGCELFLGGVWGNPSGGPRSGRRNETLKTARVSARLGFVLATAKWVAKT